MLAGQIVLLFLLASKSLGLDGDFVAKSVPDEESYNLTDLHIVGLHPFTGNTWPAGKCTSTVARMALEDIGKRKDILPGYRIVYTIMDSAVSAKIGSRIKYSLYQSLFSPFFIFFVLFMYFDRD
eukprot:GHVO01065414.1.p2 GENE.GHVO01065414.1~~GHVO01065414.1.p2  ORF type:complete len:124 (-),score=0.28 GHVO01065414.1:1005-1376(-)